VEILEEERSMLAYALRGMWVEDGATVGGGVDRWAGWGFVLL